MLFDSGNSFWIIVVVKYILILFLILVEKFVISTHFV